MRDVVYLLFQLLNTIAKLIQLGVSRAVIAEILLLKQQLIIYIRARLLALVSIRGMSTARLSAVCLTTQPVAVWIGNSPGTGYTHQKCVIRHHFGFYLSAILACDFHFRSENTLTCQYHKGR